MSEARPNPMAWIIPLSALALAAGILIGRAVDARWFSVAVLACSALLMMPLHGRARRAAFLLVVASLGLLRGSVAYHPSLPEEGIYTVSGVVADELHTRDDGQVRTILRRVRVNGKRFFSGAYWTDYLKELPDDLVPGASVTVTARLYHPQNEENPGGFNFREYLLQRGVAVGVYGMDDVVAESRTSLIGLATRIRHTLTEGLIRAMGEETGGYAAAMLLGNRELIDSEDRDAFNKLGIAHILSVSGYHVGVLAGLLAALLRRLRVRRGLRTAITAVMLAAYCLLTGMNAPVVRASVLVVLYQLGRLRLRQNSGLHLLSASAVMMLVISPTQLTGASFQLTYGAMLGMMMVLPSLERLHVLEESRFHGLWRALCAAFAAQMGILLPQIYWFQQIPLLALPLNVVILAGASAVMTLYWLVLALLPIPPAANLLGSVAGRVTSWLLTGIRALGGIEGITQWVRQANVVTFIGWAIMMASMSILWMRRRTVPIIVGAVIMALSLVPWPYPGAQYIQFGVGNADAALLRNRGMTVVIDTGEEGEDLAAFLRQQRLSIDALILTHLHSDHAGGIRALLDNRIPVKAVYVADGAMDAEIDERMLLLLNELLDTGTELHTVARGDVIELPDGIMTAVWPEAGKVRSGMDANLHSLVFHVELMGTTMLLTGDLDGDYERYAAMPVDILKVAHHGSKASTSEAFLEAVSPQTLILSCGDETRQLSMEERSGDIPLYGTREHGAVIIDFSQGAYTVRTMR